MKKDKKHVTQGPTWLSEASSVAHFESLSMEPNESAVSKIIEDDDILNDTEESDDNEVPLGKILERLKARGTKDKKLVKNGATPTPVESNSSKDNNNHDDDKSGMVKEIDSDNLGVSNGHDDEVTKSDDKNKRKRTSNQKISDLPAKRQKSKVVSAFDNIIMSDLEDKPDLEEHIDTKEHGKTDDSDVENPKVHVNTEVNNKKSESVRKRKRASGAGLAKCTSKEGESQHTTDLIGRRIKVWWPKDKEFYEGLVKSYDQQKKKHVVLYNDGDVEVLRLDKERWVFVKNSPKPTKRNKSSKNPRPKKGSSKKKIKVADNSKENKESSDVHPSSIVRGKRATRQNTKERRKKLEYAERTDSEDENEDLTFSKVDNLESEDGASDPASVKSESENVADVSESVQEDDDETELSDTMPLGVWKSRLRKSDERK